MEGSEIENATTVTAGFGWVMAAHLSIYPVFLFIPFCTLPLTLFNGDMNGPCQHVKRKFASSSIAILVS